MSSFINHLLILSCVSDEATSVGEMMMMMTMIMMVMTMIDIKWLIDNDDGGVDD